jgi:hypothetical protein
MLDDLAGDSGCCERRTEVGRQAHHRLKRLDGWRQPEARGHGAR